MGAACIRRSVLPTQFSRIPGSGIVGTLEPLDVSVVTHPKPREGFGFRIEGKYQEPSHWMPERE